ncbi:MAG: outer membrane protein assembly factor BamE [Guyparkeria sp.]|uniref:outer membrane protein assembly factor BamE n=1 Tax=Guyparkeria sp. TaxID=2035736 RepID=UPI00397815DF
MQRKLLTLPVIATLLAGCSSAPVPSFIKVYQPDIQQGNIYEEEQVERLSEGMPQSQVRSILGTPSLESIFHSGQRDTYIYYDKRGKQEAFRHTLVIEYDRVGRVASISRDGMDLSEAPSINSAELPDTAAPGASPGGGAGTSGGAQTPQGQGQPQPQPQPQGQGTDDGGQQPAPQPEPTPTQGGGI